MSGQAVSAAGLLALLDAAGARLTAVEEDTLALSGKRPPPSLLEAVRARKADVLAYLKGPAKEEAAPASPSPDVAPWEDLAPSPIQAGPPLPDWAALSAQPGHCGSCARWEAAPDWGALMGTCSCPPGAWPGNSSPLAIHAGHRCAAYREEGEDVGRGYRAAGTGKRYGPRPAPLPVQVTP